jgi:ATPase family protein associated with various cellular activities (AAA)/winged helix domain-containing protein
MTRLENKVAKATGEAPWQAQNAEAMSLGFAWLGALLAESDAGRAADTYQTHRARMRESGSPANIDRLSALFRLAPFDEDVLLLALSSQLHGRPKQVTPQLARSAFCGGSPEADWKLWERLSPQAPLRHFQLIECAERPVSATTPLLIDERIGRYLMGEDAADRRIVSLVAPVDGGPIPKRHFAGIERLDGRLRDGRPLAMIVGPKHSGRRAAAAALARGFGLALVEVRARGLEAAPDMLPVLAREAALGGFALLLDIDQTEATRLFEERLSHFDGLVIAIAEARHDFTFEMPVLRLDPLDAEDRVQLWHDALGPHTADVHRSIATVAAQFKFGPRAIAAAAAEGGNLWQACRERASRELDELAERIVPRYSWDDIVLPADVLHDLRAAAAQVQHQALVYGAHGFARKYPRGRGISVLLSGPSGTGKTMAAEVMANDLGLDLYRIDLSRVVSKYIGETEKNLRAVFDAAEASGAVLMFDEADALFGKRSEVKDSHDRYANIEVSYLLQRMESYGGLAILATNMKGHLDAAFLRRLRYAIDVPFPDAAARRLIWQKTFPDEMPCAGLDFEALARLDIAGGNIAVIAINAAFLAATDGVPLDMRHIARAARAEYRKLDRELRLNWLGIS